MALDYAALPDIASASLPAVYETAKRALAECSRVDECQHWANKAKALASYAKQARDESLRKMAVRIQARAVRRCGELLRQIPSVQGARTDIQPRDGDDTKCADRAAGASATLTRTSAAAEAGLSERQKVTALRVAAVPEESFTAQVDSAAPPTVTNLAEQGRKPLIDLEGRKPQDVENATEALGVLSDFAEFCRTNDAASVANGVFSGEGVQARTDVATINAWLHQFITMLPT